MQNMAASLVRSSKSGPFGLTDYCPSDVCDNWKLLFVLFDYCSYNSRLRRYRLNIDNGSLNWFGLCEWRRQSLTYACPAIMPTTYQLPFGALSFRQPVQYLHSLNKYRQQIFSLLLLLEIDHYWKHLNIKLQTIWVLITIIHTLTNP